MIGLVQPIAAHGRRCLLQRGQMGLDVGGSQRHHFLEHFAAFLAEGLVARVRVAVLAAVEKAEVVADAVGKLGGQLGAQHFPLVGRSGTVGPLDNYRRADIAKDEVAVAVIPGLVARGDLGVDHQHALGAAGTHGVDGLLDGKGGRRAGHIHVKPIAARPQRLLDLDGHGRVGALHVGRRAQHGINLVAGLAGGIQRLARGIHGNLGHQRELVVGPLGKARVHAGRVQHAGFFEHIALLDAGGLFDEFDAGIGQRLAHACGDFVGKARVFLVHIAVEGFNQLGIGNGVRGLVNAGSADDN